MTRAATVLGTARIVRRLAVPVRSEQAMTLLDWLRQIGPLTTDEYRQVLAHATTSSAGRYLVDLEAEGLVSRTRRGRKRVSWDITDYGRGVA